MGTAKKKYKEEVGHPVPGFIKEDTPQDIQSFLLRYDDGGIEEVISYSDYEEITQLDPALHEAFKGVEKAINELEARIEKYIIRY